jgi:hypothetical protein
MLPQDLGGVPHWADLEQNVDFTRAVTIGDLHTLVTHGMLWNFGSQRVLMGLEHLQVQGVPVWSSSDPPKTCPFSGVFSSIGDKVWKHMAGNAWHLPTVASLMAYVFISTVPRGSIMPSISSLTAGDCVDQDDGSFDRDRRHPLKRIKFCAGSQFF